MDYSLKNQMSLVERGYFSELYHQLGICKVADDKIFDLFSQYQKYGNFNWIDSYFVIIKGYHWFDTEDLDEYLTLADEIIADRFEFGDRPQIEAALTQDYEEGLVQRERVAAKLHMLLHEYQFDCTTDQEDMLISGIGMAFSRSDACDEPQTNLYLYKSHLLFQLREMNLTETNELFRFVDCMSALMWTDKDAKVFCFASVQEYLDSGWILSPSALYAICALTVVGKQLAKQNVVLQKAIEEDHKWYQDIRKKEKKRCKLNLNL